MTRWFLLAALLGLSLVPAAHAIPILDDITRALGGDPHVQPPPGTWTDLPGDPPPWERPSAPTPEPAPAPLPEPIPVPPADDTPFALSGRLGVMHDGRGFYGNLLWQHGAGTDTLRVLTPLGQAVAELNRDATGVSLLTSRGERYEATDAESLTETALGWRLPLAGLAWWAQGRLAPGSGERLEGDRARQDGWEIEWERPAPDARPTRTLLRREGLEVRLVVDRWEDTP